MSFRKVASIIPTLVLGVWFTGNATAAQVLNFRLNDVGQNLVNAPGNYSPIPDGVAGAFIVDSPLNVQSYSGATLFSGNSNNGVIEANTAEIYFSAGTAYGSSTVELFTYGSGFNADITNGNLTFGSLDIGMNIIPGTLYVPPDPGSLVVNWVTASGLDTYDVSFSWSHYFLYDPLDSGVPKTYNLYMEGTMTTAPVPVPAAAWLFGSGLAGLVTVTRRKKAK